MRFKFILSFFMISLFLCTGDLYSRSLYEFIIEENNTKNIIKTDTADNINNEPDDGNDIPGVLDSLPSYEGREFFETIDDLSICRNEYVRKYIYQYLTQARPFLINAVVRSDRYLEIIEDIMMEADYKDMPEDISLLPVLESAFNPCAVSRSRAVGMWQLLRGTSRDLGLKVNRWVDERRDIEKSTYAALTHLKNLYGMFGSWDLALTAYNGGAAYLKKAMIRSKSKNLMELIDSGCLNRETSEFALRFAALSVIFRNPDLFMLNDDLPDYNAVETVNYKLKYPVKIRTLSGKTGIPVEMIKRYNPELKSDITPPYEKNYTLRIPSDSVEILERNIAKLYRVKFKDIHRHIVKKGECLSKIAALYNIKMRDIIELNNIKNPHLIRPGFELYIPI